MTCPHCGNEHPDGTAFCPETGQSIPAAAPPRAAAPRAPAPLAAAPHVEPKGIGALLQQAFDLYTKQFVPLVITCGIVLIPIALVASALQFALLPGAVPTSRIQRIGERSQARSRELRDLSEKARNG